MIFLLSLLAYSSLSTSNNDNDLIDNALQKYFKLNKYILDDNSTMTTQPPQKKFPLVPVIVSCVFVVIVLIIALYFLCKKIKQMKYYTDVGKQEREMELITQPEIPNVLDGPSGIIEQNEETKAEIKDPEQKIEVINPENEKAENKPILEEEEEISDANQNEPNGQESEQNK